MDLLEAAASPWNLLWLVGIFGIAPGFCLRIMVRVYPPKDPRRDELVAQLYTLGRIERLLFVGEQLETVFFEGFSARRAYQRSRYTSWAREQLRGDWVVYSLALAPTLFALFYFTALVFTASDVPLLLGAASGTIACIGYSAYRLTGRLQRRRRICRFDLAMQADSLSYTELNDKSRRRVSVIAYETGYTKVLAEEEKRASRQRLIGRLHPCAQRGRDRPSV